MHAPCLAPRKRSGGVQLATRQPEHPQRLRHDSDDWRWKRVATLVRGRDRQSSVLTYTRPSQEGARKERAWSLGGLAQGTSMILRAWSRYHASGASTPPSGGTRQQHTLDAGACTAAGRLALTESKQKPIMVALSTAHLPQTRGSRARPARPNSAHGLPARRAGGDSDALVAHACADGLSPSSSC